MSSDPVSTTLRILQDPLCVFIHREMCAKHGENWQRLVQSPLHVEDGQVQFDLGTLLAIVERHWQTVFVRRLSTTDRADVSVLRGVRNQCE